MPKLLQVSPSPFKNSLCLPHLLICFFSFLPQCDKATTKPHPGSGGRLGSDDGVVQQQMPQCCQNQEEDSCREAPATTGALFPLQDVCQVLLCKQTACSLCPLLADLWGDLIDVINVSNIKKILPSSCK